MISRKTIERFIELRSEGNTFDEIAEVLKVSKPTLIKWSREYKKEIDYAKEYLTTKLAEKIARNNKQLINNIAMNINRADTLKNYKAEVRDKFVEKSFKRLGDIFKVDVKNIVISLNNEGDVTRVEINVSPD